MSKQKCNRTKTQQYQKSFSFYWFWGISKGRRTNSQCQLRVSQHSSSYTSWQKSTYKTINQRCSFNNLTQWNSIAANISQTKILDTKSPQYYSFYNFKMHNMSKNQSNNSNTINGSVATSPSTSITSFSAHWRRLCWSTWNKNAQISGFQEVQGIHSSTCMYDCKGNSSWSSHRTYDGRFPVRV